MNRIRSEYYAQLQEKKKAAGWFGGGAAAPAPDAHAKH